MVIVVSVNLQQWLTGHNYDSLQSGCPAAEKEKKRYEIESSKAVKTYPDAHARPLVCSVLVFFVRNFCTINIVSLIAKKNA